jgi:putative phosphoesterase
MKKVAIISDTHGFWDKKISNLIHACDEVWHAGDFGYSEEIEQNIQKFNIKGVYGNIDGKEIRQRYSKILKFHCEKIKVLITHIGGYPNRYQPDLKEEIKTYNPDLYICGHSHILKIMYDKKYNLLHINPGSAGKEGFHKTRTIVLLEIHGQHIKNVQVAELGPRVKLTKPIN